ncbi:DUF7716 domain-containing protein [Dyella tabacisoli]|uniref:DUF7716 domain-containing protein n=1 Tax=Dyella tabacisoli TaxID=2282381 RepID=A0A369UQT3_9GAMM|nr:hypothetical protein [Dyella tabacisoli]RDD82098.1 hypothetical protein DVJ77_08535 [Dyella tabacisoli]
MSDAHTLLSLQETIEAIAASCDDGDVWDRYAWVYVNKGDALIRQRFYLSSAEDEEDLLVDENGESLPLFAAERDLHHYLEAATFADVLIVQKRQQPLSQLDDYAAALEHYHRQDAFRDLGDFHAGTGDAPALPGIARGLSTEFDLQLAECPAERVGDAARATASLLDIPIAEALARCRQLPLVLGERIDPQQCARIERAFAALSLSLRRTTYRALAWL